MTVRFLLFALAAQLAAGALMSVLSVFNVATAAALYTPVLLNQGIQFNLAAGASRLFAINLTTIIPAATPPNQFLQDFLMINANSTGSSSFDISTSSNPSAAINNGACHFGAGARQCLLQVCVFLHSFVRSCCACLIVFDVFGVWCVCRWMTAPPATACSI